MTALVKNIIGAKPEPNAAEVRFVTIDGDSAGQRLDNFLFRHLKGVPKTHVYRIIRSGEVRINKGRVHAETRVEAGDVLRLPPVRVSTADKHEAGAVPAREFPVVHEDDYLIAIDKAAGVAVHGGSGVSSGVIEQLRQARTGARFLELVHRLDRETSGLLLIAKKRSALVALQAEFRERKIGKTYLAMVEGRWAANRKVIDNPLAKYLVAKVDGSSDVSERRVRVVAKDHPDAMRAVSLVSLVSVFALTPGGAECSLLAVTIKTGRTHQIRVHLASCGHPIAGDDKYGNFERNRALHRLGLKRMFLHAWRLRFAHPETGAEMSLQADLPPDLRALLPESASQGLAGFTTSAPHE